MSSPEGSVEQSQSHDLGHQMTHGTQQAHNAMAVGEHAMNMQAHAHCNCDCLCDFCGVSGLALLCDTLSGVPQAENRFNLTIPVKLTSSAEESLFRPPILA